MATAVPMIATLAGRGTGKGRETMNMIATNMVPNDEQLYCWHMVGIVSRPDGGQTILDRDNQDLLKKMGGYAFAYCPLCGGRLEVSE
jgi:hypothetical protein